jgi:O-antigen ligase
VKISAIRGSGKLETLRLAVRMLAGLGLCVLLVLAHLYFSPPLCLVLAGLALLSGVRPAWGAAVLFAIISVDTVQPLFGSIYVSFSELELAACILGWSAFKGLKEADWRVLAWGAPFTVAVFLSGLVNTPLYKVPPHTLRASELLLALFFASSVVRGPAARKLFAIALTAATVFYSVAGLMQIKPALNLRIYSFFTNPNQLAGYLVLVLPVLLALFLHCARHRFRPVFAYAGLVGVAALMATFSRGGMVAFLVGFTLVVAVHLGSKVYRVFRYSEVRSFLSSRLRTPVRSGMVLSIHLLVLLTGTLFMLDKVDVQPLLYRSATYLKHRVFKETGDNPMAVRDTLVSAGLTMWSGNRWTGVGPGNYAVATEDYLQERATDSNLPSPIVFQVNTHNLFIQLLVDYGVLGLASFLVLIVYLLSRLVSSATRSPWALGGLGLLAAFFAHNMVDVTFPSLALEMGLLLGVALRAAKDMTDQSGPMAEKRASGKVPLDQL